MALNSTTLRDGLRKYVDPSYGSYVGFPADASGVGLAWGEALRSYFNGLASPPGVTTIQQTAAQAAFSAVFVPTFESDALALLNTALTAYVALLVSPVGVTVPPPGVPSITLSNTTDGSAAATTIATAIDTWARTGTYTAPAGSPVPWS